eukprot:3876109-Pyramimonas_sp.AAC.1
MLARLPRSPRRAPRGQRVAATPVRKRWPVGARPSRPRNRTRKSAAVTAGCGRRSRRKGGGVTSVVGPKHALAQGRPG